MNGARLTEAPFDGQLAHRLAITRQQSQIALHWLGQAGFVITTRRHRLVIDPYLSDSLALKYRSSSTPHDRMMAAPATPGELGAIDLVLCTHHHSDHMDGETLGSLARLNPDIRFIVPRSALALATERIGVDNNRLIGLDAGETVEALPGVAISAFPAAHEALDKDAAGNHRFLGYGIATDGARLFHSGDTIPIPGQAENLSNIAADLALLPVNGRSARLRAAGIAGNLTIAEAISLCDASGIPAMIAHHYGMFAFNTVSPDEIDKAAAVAPLRMLRAKLQMEYSLHSR
jgi:L-ascorbate metabolism protein UlaG (beta-lactamase superfamily)